MIVHDGAILSYARHGALAALRNRVSRVMSELLRHLPLSSTAAVLIFAVLKLLHPALLAAIQHKNSTRKRVEILLSGAAYVAVLLFAVWVAWRLVARLA